MLTFFFCLIPCFPNLHWACHWSVFITILGLFLLLCRKECFPTRPIDKCLLSSCWNSSACKALVACSKALWHADASSYKTASLSCLTSGKRINQKRCSMRAQDLKQRSFAIITPQPVYTCSSHGRCRGFIITLLSYNLPKTAAIESVFSSWAES